MSVRQDEPFGVQVRDNAALARALRASTYAALGCGVGGVVLPAPVGPVAAWVAFALVVVVPLVRVALLGIRWTHRGDRLYALLAAVLLVIVAAGGAVALLLARGSG